jgi:hypothetical protein
MDECTPYLRARIQQWKCEALRLRQHVAMLREVPLFGKQTKQSCCSQGAVAPRQGRSSMTAPGDYMNRLFGSIRRECTAMATSHRESQKSVIRQGAYC